MLKVGLHSIHLDPVHLPSNNLHFPSPLLILAAPCPPITLKASREPWGTQLTVIPIGLLPTPVSSSSMDMRPKVRFGRALPQLTDVMTCNKLPSLAV
ncbi:MAG: hypothetical protein FRX49_10138 [Trebouxia sp. A1-2]|nr:MAG: hypothetical protein FRX49_10138 [Trebouxia sp. A1-2]